MKDTQIPNLYMKIDGFSISYITHSLDEVAVCSGAPATSGLVSSGFVVE